MGLTHIESQLVLKIHYQHNMERSLRYKLLSYHQNQPFNMSDVIGSQQVRITTRQHLILGSVVIRTRRLPIHNLCTKIGCKTLK